MLWQLRMGDRNGGEGSVLLRLTPELFLPVLRLPSEGDTSADVGVCKPPTSAFQEMGSSAHPSPI